MEFGIEDREKLFLTVRKYFKTNKMKETNVVKKAINQNKKKI